MSEPEINIWRTMIARCVNPNHEKFSIYGLRGISVCERWLNYENFLYDMGKRPSKKHSIDRIDNNGNYEPENCRWATAAEQANNRSSNVVIEINGVRMPLKSACEILNLPYKTIHARMRIYGWNIDDALNKPIMKGKKND